MIKDISSGLKAPAFGENNFPPILNNFYNRLSVVSLNYQIIDAFSASIYLKDINGVYIGCNKYMAKMAGLECRDQIIGKTDYDLPWRKQAEDIRKIDQLVINNNQTHQLEEKPEIHDGSMRILLSSKTPILDNDNKIIGIIGVSIDITDQKAIEKRLELTEEYLEKSSTIKERFLRNISHETRTPMHGIVGNAEILADQWDRFDDKQKYEGMKIIAESARRLELLINNTFDLSDLLNNDAELKLEKSNINELVKSAISSFNDRVEVSRKKARIVIKETEIYSLVFDKQKIKQMIDNLLMNAIKWTDPNEVITVELYKDSIYHNNDVSGIYCRVSNNGIQIPPDELDSVFESFTESSNTASKACGVGLGLALCREIIKAHHGGIQAQNNSTGAAGVSVTFFIPDDLMESSIPEKKSGKEGK